MKIIVNIIILVFFGTSVSEAQTLDDYLKIAAENNPGLQAKYREFEAAIQKVEQVNTLPDPNFSFGYFISPVETRVGPQRARFSLTQMFPWFGTLKAQGDAAALMAEAKYQSFLDARNRLYYQVAAAYYPLYELNQWKEIERENIEILESYKTITNKKFENGAGTMVDFLRVDIMLKDAKTNLSILNDKEVPLLTRFNKLLNREEDALVIVEDSLFAQALPDNFRKDSLLTNNPMLEELDLKIASSEASEEVAYKQGLPKFGVGLDYVMVGERTDLASDMAAPQDNGKNALMPMVSVSIPIFRSKYKAAVKEAQLMQESFALQKEDFANTLTSNYEMSWFEIQQQQELLELYDQQIQESNQALNLLFTAYGNSGKEFEEVLRMQQQLLKYEKMKATAETQYQIALARLNYLTAKTY
ncbi:MULTISPECIES: TolC family protein [Cyclobacterium]|jgi:outer membrane protein TolC|uniref:Outer membrane efflux protein n=1 Tax=Cyclobacterium marinum (strain ATCC 25205 / DSM 745 / LMG 13164 / NCIMB 1802) TaxID=880070 RepID=G0J1S6_CYCMS|nr:TolC family protein [Cyclobacterium marinum]AEL28285.1 outer membrane efflux protein [Cyclobacterium marinum DSM 745]|tara:strand:+ start:45036 stop:46283 length:1248 start_codon:yes stop_codon:yes gene_type:complete